jgi:hypothetical protein
MRSFGGFDLPDYFPIYKNGKRWEHKADLIEVAALTRALHAWRP